MSGWEDGGATVGTMRVHYSSGKCSVRYWRKINKNKRKRSIKNIIENKEKGGRKIQRLKLHI